MADKVIKVNGKWYVNGRPTPHGFQQKEGNAVYQYNSDGTKTLLRYTDNTPNYDNTPTGRYITAVENPDSAGYYNGRWYNKGWADAHRKLTPRVWDSNQIGIGLDMKKENNPLIQNYLKSVGATTSISEADEHYVRQHQIQDKVDTLNRLMKKNNINVKMSPFKQAMAVGLVYHGLGKYLVKPSGALTQAISDAFKNGTDKQFANALANFYTQFQNGRFKERAKQHTQFWNGKLKSGGRINFYQTGGEMNDPFSGSPYQVFNGFTTPPYEEIVELPVSVPDNELIPIPEGNTYKVKSGDSLWQIARNHGMSLSKLLKMNPELNIKSIIHPGDEIYTGDYKLLKRSKKSNVKKSNVKKSTTDIRKVWDRKKPYEAASSQKEYEYRRSTQPEFVAHELANIPYRPVQHLYDNPLQKFMNKAAQYPNPTVAGKTYWINNPYIK